MKKLTLLALIALISCQTTPTAQDVADSAIQKAGVAKLENATASFTFRGIAYDYQLRNGNFRYTRTLYDTLGNTIRDVLVNGGLNRFVNDSLVQLEDKKRAAYSASVNSVIYFAFLPMSLNDGAVNKEYVGQSKIKNTTYHKIRVTFNAEGGGEDFEDVFYYWFDTEDYSMDYLAYSYNEDHGKGLRFREAYNVREVDGVVIQDYNNYKPKVEEGFLLEGIDKAFENNELQLLSKIELEDMQISL